MPRFISIREVKKRTSLSRATICREIAAGRFPKQKRISRARVGWLESEVDGWAEEFIEEDPECSDSDS